MLLLYPPVAAADELLPVLLLYALEAMGGSGKPAGLAGDDPAAAGAAVKCIAAGAVYRAVNGGGLFCLHPRGVLLPQLLLLMQSPLMLSATQPLCNPGLLLRY